MNRTCVGCGADYESRVYGCRRCNDRHLKRRTLGYRSIRSCAGCGGHLAEELPGCRVCYRRHYMARRRAA